MGLGMGVMINMLGGNAETVDTLKGAIGKTIKRVWLGDDDALHFAFTDGTGMKMFDDGQSCCESRYMRTDDDLTVFAGSTLTGASIRNSQAEEGEYGDVHEVQFLVVDTDRGSFTMASHNEHNGYYGGFWIVCKPE